MIENITNNLTANYKKSAKRPGRGISAGQGKTAGRGTKGQKSRAGHNIPNRFEGGQTVLAMRLPKIRGFKSHSEKAIVITLDDISQNFKNGETVSSQSLKDKGLIKHESQKVKILNNGTLSIKVKIEDIQISKSVSELLQHSDKPEKKEKQIIE